jgi:hypothetical protein
MVYKFPNGCNYAVFIVILFQRRQVLRTLTGSGFRFISWLC